MPVKMENAYRHGQTTLKGSDHMGDDIQMGISKN
jgi:hypothetical protein